jgi:hypothetical protein
MLEVAPRATAKEMLARARRAREKMERSIDL